MGRVAHLPVLVIAGLVAALAMLVPAAHAEATGAHRIATVFAGSAAGALVLGTMLALATAATPAAAPSRGVLGTLLSVYAGLPLSARATTTAKRISETCPAQQAAS